MKKKEIGGETVRSKSLFNTKGSDSVVNLLPYKSCSREGVVKKSDNTYQAFLSVKTTDLESMNDDELAQWCNALTRLSQIYSPSLKLISMSRKTSVPEQIDYWRTHNRITERAKAQHINVGQNQIISDIERATLAKLHALERNSTELKFYFMVSAKNKKELAKSVRSLKILGGRELGLEMQNRREVTAIIFRMNNMNDEGDYNK
ncbi:hypothetical protein EQ500_01560 [Lactobacillus sp. XV13L]|nr:hypothetical protein [Lactobacillus sp. XV13L]